MRAGRPRSQAMVIAAWCAMRMTVSCEYGATWFPHLLSQGEGLGGLRPPKLFTSRWRSPVLRVEERGLPWNGTRKRCGPSNGRTP